jgi:hypothetical protein
MSTLQGDVERVTGLLRVAKAENEDLRVALEAVASGATAGAGAGGGGATAAGGSTLHATTPATAVLMAGASRAELLSQLTKLRNQCGEMEVVRAANERQVALLAERVTTLEQSLMEVRAGGDECSRGARGRRRLVVMPLVCACDAQVAGRANAAEDNCAIARRAATKVSRTRTRTLI